jgi:hypothetical protein
VTAGRRPLPPEGVLQLAVEHARPGLEREVRAALGPAHRLALGEALGDNLVDRALGEAGRDALAGAVVFAIVDDLPRVVLRVGSRP